MELHSYAKRKALKKWTIEQKRKLVEARIHYDSVFSNQPWNSMLPWKKVLSLSKLDDFNAFFVRKQWSTMVAKYKQYKQNRLDNIPTQSIDKELINKITQEWEFFRPIHHFMTYKTTNLHSYAQKMHVDQLHDQDQDENVANNANDVGAIDRNHIVDSQQNSTSSTDNMMVFSSDTNEDFATVDIRTESPTQNTDHDFYTKRLSYHQSNYFADISEDTQESVKREPSSSPIRTPSPPPQTVVHEPNIFVKQEPIGEESTFEEPFVENPSTQAATTTATTTAATTTTHENDATINVPTTSTSTGKSNSERDKYYRHKRRFNRRLERRFDCLLNVVGQIAKAEYPSIDVAPLRDVVTAGRTLVNTLFSSSDEEEEDNNSNESLLNFGTIGSDK